MRRVIITGASGGIGAAIAAALVAGGDQVMLVGRRNSVLAELAEQLGVQARYLVLDITAADAGERLVQACRAAQWQPDCLINNAGVMHFGWLGEQPAGALEQTLNTNLLAPMRLCRALLPELGEGGLIVNIGSIFGDIGYPGFAAYCAAKAGLARFSEALDRENGPAGPRVCYLAPRATATSLNSCHLQAMNQELGNRADPPERVAAEVLALLVRPRRYRSVGWPESLFVRINRWWPRLVDRNIARQLGRIRYFAKLENAK